VLPVLHGGGLPHTDTLGVPGWVQWSVLALVAVVAAWLIRDGRRARQRSAPRPEPIRPVVPQSTSTRSGLVKTAVIAESVARPPKPRPAAVERAPVNPVGFLILVLAGIAGWMALDRARSVDALATFIRTPGGENAARLAFAVASLFWAAGVVAVVAPRLAAALFAIATGLLIALARAGDWERRLEWFGASAVLKSWSNLTLWCLISAGFAFLSLAAHFYPRLLNRR
jgi:hypothetical protein